MLADTVMLEFNQYTPGSRWRQTAINRKDHREAGNEGDGFYGGIRKLHGNEEIAMWKRLWPTKILEQFLLIHFQTSSGPFYLVSHDAIKHQSFQVNHILSLDSMPKSCDLAFRNMILKLDITFNFSQGHVEVLCFSVNGN